MGRMNIYLDDTEDKKLDRLKDRFNINSKEEVIKRLIKKFPEQKQSKPIIPTDGFDMDEETTIEDMK